jgi:Holliday junction resolvase RusA-like endonuclease
VRTLSRDSKGRAGSYETGEAKAFKQAVAIFSRGQSVDGESYAVTCVYYLGHKQRGDIDNFLKCSLDALVCARVIHSDAAIQKITAEKFRDKENPRTEFTIEAAGCTEGRAG